MATIKIETEDDIFSEKSGILSSREVAAKSTPTTSNVYSSFGETEVRGKPRVESTASPAVPLPVPTTTLQRPQPTPPDGIPNGRLLVPADDQEGVYEPVGVGGDQGLNEHHLKCGCLQCTRVIQKHRKITYAVFITVVALSILMMIGIAIAEWETEGDHTGNYCGKIKPIILSVPPKTTYKYELERGGDVLDYLLLYRGIHIDINKSQIEGGLVQVGLGNGEGDTYTENLNFTVKPGSTIVRHWSGGVEGTIKCTGDIEMVVTKVSLMAVYNKPSQSCSSDKILILCIDESMSVSNISECATGKDELTVIEVCKSNEESSYAEIQFSEQSQLLASDTPTYNLDRNNPSIYIDYKTFAAVIAKKKPAIYISTQYLQYSNESPVSITPVTLEITFRCTSRFIISFMVVNFLLVLIAVLLCYCYRRHYDKRACTVSCLYVKGPDV